MKYKVVVTDWVFENLEPEAEILAPVGGEIVAIQAKSQDELIEVARDADAILNTYFGPIDEHVIGQLEKCKVIVRYGIGVDTIDILSATKHGIMIANVPDYCIDEVSEHTMALMLALARKLFVADQTARGGDWVLGPLKPLQRVAGQTAGVVGFGRIGRSVAAKAKAFGMNVLCFDPVVSKQDAAKAGAESVSLDELLAQSDFVLLHCPANEKTRHLIGEAQLKAMKKTAFLVNTARGALVDTPALATALKAGEIAGAALDDVDSKPPTEHAALLADCANVILTPHSAWFSAAALHDLQRLAAEEVKRVLSGEKPKSFLNPEVAT